MTPIQLITVVQKQKVNDLTFTMQVKMIIKFVYFLKF